MMRGQAPQIFFPRTATGWRSKIAEGRFGYGIIRVACHIDWRNHGHVRYKSIAKWVT